MRQDAMSRGAAGARRGADRGSAQGGDLSAARVLALALWATLIVGCVAVPLAAPGILAHRDMLVLDHPGLSASAFGFGDLPARNVPQDALLALTGLVLPASWVARGLIVAAAAGAVTGSALLARHCGAGAPAMAAAMLIGGLNPGVVERLLQGQWSFTVAAWLLPLVCWAFLTSRVPLGWALMVPASLTPSGALITGLVGAVTHQTARWARGVRRARRGSGRRASSGLSAGIPPWLTWAIAAALCLPWLVPALVGAAAGAPAGTATAGSAAAFAPRAEAHLGTLGTLLTFGGLWNSAAAPDSREAGFGIFGLALAALFALGWRSVPRTLRWLAYTGLAIACASWLLPEWFSWVVATLPGGGLARDAQKFIFLAVPAAIAALAGLRRPLAWLALLLALLQAWDFPGALRALAPVPDPLPVLSAEIDDSRGVLVLGAGTFADIGGVPTVNPWDKALPTVQSGEITVGEEVIDDAAPRHRAALGAWQAGDLGRLAELGVGWVLSGEDGRILARTDAAVPGRWPIVAGVGLTALWAAVVPLAYVFARKRRG